MQYINSIQFYQRNEKQIVILFFKIEAIKYSRFRNPFVTDKYIDVVQYEYIMFQIKKLIDSIICYGEDWIAKKHEFTYQNLSVCYEAVPRQMCCIDYEKMSYDFDWIIDVTINRVPNDTKSFNVIECSDTLENLEPLHESKKAKTDDDSSSVSKKQQNHHNLMFRNDSKIDNMAQPSVSKWFSTSKSSRASNEESKPQKKSKKVKELKPSTSKDSILLFNKEKLKKMNEFIARTEKEEIGKESRKIELADYELLNCFKMTDDELSKICMLLKGRINKIFKKPTSLEGYLDNEQISPIEITSSNILDTKQCMFVLNEIENLREPDEKGTEDLILHEAVFPYVLLEIFKRKHSLSMSDAIRRIRTQEEKKALFNQFDDSY